MLGMEGVGVFLAYIMTLAAAALCVVYGVMNWNKPKEEEVSREISEEIEWEKHDPESEERG